MLDRFFYLSSAVLFSVLLSVPTLAAQQEKLPGCWPQEYTVQHDPTAGLLTLSTPYYQVVHDLRAGGVISKIIYTHGRAGNLLVKPIESRVRLADENRTSLGDIHAADARISWSEPGLYPTVSVECSLQDEKGNKSGITVRTTYNYRWGYIKINKQFIFPAGEPVRVKEICALSAVFHPSLSDYGYRRGIAEQELADPFDFGVCQWGKIRPGTHFDNPLQTRFVPRYIVLANHGIEGIEWFVSSDLSQWDYQLTGRPGDGFCYVGPSLEPLGVSVSVSAVSLPRGSVALQGSYTFDYYIGMPILEGHANPIFCHASFQRKNWPSGERVREWAESGIKTAHFHHDGDTFRDGLFWRDGTYPPFGPEDMKEYDRVIETCHRYGIRVATYFSNKELYPTTEAYKKHGEEWGRKADDQGALRHNYYSGDEYGAQMCLKSGWLDYFKNYVNTVLTNHKLDGIYYDWNCALFCNNPLHVGKTSNNVSGEKGLGALALSPTGHWDMDELIGLMEWTRERVGPDGLVIVHNTMVPACVIENFANYVVAMEWGYGMLTESVPEPKELPLEWDFMGARSRGVIGYGTIARGAPQYLHQLLALETLLTSVAPWPLSREAMDLFKILKPLGDLEQYRFEDWRNKAVALDIDNCASALYSRPGETYVILGNLGTASRTVSCRIDPECFPYPLDRVSSCELGSLSLDPGRLTGSGEKITVPGSGAVMLKIK
ncbi:MAG TPA: DUF6259 domain-containing protein [archaeon]|nr:DUF6259 domain-containing protein [archaeon]